MNPRRKNLRFLTPLTLLLILNNAPASEPVQEEQALFDFVNSERIRADLSPLIWDSDLYGVAAAHSQDMAASEKMDHKGSDGTLPSDRVRNAGVYASRVGENVARDVNVISAHTMLMGSLEHRKNILDPDFTHAAVGIVRKDGYAYITELFIRKIKDYSLKEGRQLLLEQINAYRKSKNLSPLLLSDPLSLAAQSHVEEQGKLGKMSPALGGAMGAVVRFVSVYTTEDLASIPPEIQSDLQLRHQSLGIGFTKVRNSICNMGCYLVVLVFS